MDSENSPTDLKLSVEAALLAINEKQKAAALLVEGIQSKLNEVTQLSREALAAKTAIIDEQAVIATKSSHIQGAQEHADKVRAELDRVLTSAKLQLTEAEGHKVRAESAAGTATGSLSEFRTAKVNMEAEVTAIANAKRIAEESSVAAKSLAEKSSALESKIQKQQEDLAKLLEQNQAQSKKIEELLRGATNVGLAKSFDARRETFIKPHNRWQVIFVGSVAVIVALTVTGLWHYFSTSTVPTYDELLRLWLSRLPVVGALVWLALHASREAALAKRLEEDYGYKAAIASCFEGFKAQVSAVGGNIPADSALAKLLTNTLETIAMPPGRIYEKHELVVSPSKELHDVASGAADTIAKAKG